ncbi:PBSX family phage terminase large subunit [Desulfosporosinus hippei]|uniref:Phage terminase large subunit n=1 Tax=Desulfosporosinus hippei DSM 8344 TaxID=1121419 RepID=A0A1G7UJW8_9FIRM|nr:PBSX family phage terminase large subunit [Desulfosporosinus hippei]SDG47824.1 phage terminase large subunit [Desulfosporosinus hippei DSM 8344]
MKKIEEINLPEIVGKGYGSFWRSKKRYRVLKGGRGSKKSATTALWFIFNIMKHGKANAVVVRKTFNTHKDSTYAQLKWAAKRLGVYDKWKFTLSPLEATYIPTGQKILFRGFDDVLKLTSITVDTGVLCWVWLEEAYEIEDEKDFSTLDESIRGEMPDGLWKQLTLTFNPWVNSHWTKKRFFDNSDPEAFTLTTTYKCNEWLDDADRKLIEDLEVTNPDRFKVVGLGDYGIPGGTYFDEFRTDIHVVEPFVIPPDWRRFTTKDYGLDKLANYWITLDPENNAYVYKELYESDLIVSEAAKRIKKVNGTDSIKIKYAPPDLENRQKDTGKSIFDLFRENGESLTKSDNSRVAGWMALKEWIKIIEKRDIETGEIIKTSRMKIFSNCVNLIRTLPQVQKDEADPNDVATDPHELTHAPDALRGFCIMRQCAPIVETKKKTQHWALRDDNPKPQSYVSTDEAPEGYLGGW